MLSEQQQDYPHVVVNIRTHFRLIECRDHIQWILQRRDKNCRYAVTRGTFPLSSQYWEEGDVYEQRSTRDTAQATDTSTR